MNSVIDRAFPSEFKVLNVEDVEVGTSDAEHEVESWIDLCGPCLLFSVLLNGQICGRGL
jgi:hypothetical protein